MKTRLRFIRKGCATQMENCPNGEHALTVQPLDSKGRDKGGGTHCVSALKVTEFVND